MHTHYNATLLPTYYLLTYMHTHIVLDNDILNNGDDDKFAVLDTQESSATFSRKIIKKLGIRRSSMGTDVITNNNAAMAT